MPSPNIETEDKFEIEVPLEEQIGMVNDDAAAELAKEWCKFMDEELQKAMGLKQPQSELNQVIDKHT